jgi:hypothetical protein
MYCSTISDRMSVIAVAGRWSGGNSAPLLRRFPVACLALILVCVTTLANAALESRLAGLAYYDTALDVTWLTDANAIAGSAWDDGPSTSDGLVSWHSALDWASNLTVNGIGGWNLPSMDADGDDVVVDCRDIPEAVCRDNHYGYMFYHNGVTGVSPGPFTPHLQAYGYWAETETVPYEDIIAWLFTFGEGIQHPLGKTFFRHAWAVRSGDIAIFENGALTQPLESASLAYGQPAYVAYDNFTVNETVTVTGIDWYGTEPAAGGYSGTDFSIHSGVPNAANLIVSGTAQADRIDMGVTTSSGAPAYEYSLKGLDITLAPGTYYLGLGQNGAGESARWLLAEAATLSGDSYQSQDGALFGPAVDDLYFRIVGYVAPDTDGDGVPDNSDNCPAVANTSQADKDDNAVGDACEPPRVTGLWPADAAVGEIISMYVFGDYFDGSPGATRILVNGLEQPLVQVVSQQMLIVRMTVTEGMAGPVTVITPNGSVPGPDFGIPGSGLAISGVWPASAAAEDVVFVFGHAFDLVPGATQVTVGSVTAPLVHVVSDSMLLFSVPSAAVSGPVFVTTPAGTVYTATDLLVVP